MPVGREILGLWGEDAGRIEPLAGGVANDVWSVRVRGHLAVGRLGARSDADLAWETELLQHLDREGLTVSLPIPPTDGRLFADGTVVVTFVEGERPEPVFHSGLGRRRSSLRGVRFGERRNSTQAATTGGLRTSGSLPQADTTLLAVGALNGNVDRIGTRRHQPRLREEPTWGPITASCFRRAIELADMLMG